MCNPGLSTGRVWPIPYGVFFVFAVAFLASLVLLEAADMDVSNLNSVPGASAVDEDDLRRVCFRSLLSAASLAEEAAGEAASERVNAVPPATAALSHHCRTALARALLAETAPLPDALA